MWGRRLLQTAVVGNHKRLKMCFDELELASQHHKRLVQSPNIYFISRAGIKLVLWLDRRLRHGFHHAFAGLLADLMNYRVWLACTKKGGQANYDPMKGTKLFRYGLQLPKTAKNGLKRSSGF